MYSLSVSIEGQSFAQLADLYGKAPDLVKQKAADAVNRSLLAYQATAKQVAPIRQGILRAGIQINPARIDGNTVTGSVEATAPHSLFQEQGTGIYGPSGQPIRPKSAKVLAWSSGGKMHFAKQVKGSRPHWYMRTSAQQNRLNTQQNFEQAVAEVAAVLKGRS
jgi:hypothetical protein